MSVQKTGDIRRKVTSVGNSWIVCNSRSHPGLVYYFNTLTGEAVWNLSSAEIEKAKQRTKDLEQQSGAKPTKCPEPIQPPSSNLLNNTPPEIQYINPFVVNPSISSQNIAPFAGTNQILAQQISQINNPAVNVMNTLEPLNSSISTVNVQTTSIYNPKVWAVPLTQQVYISPPTNVLGNHVNGSGIGPFNNFNQAVTQPLSLNNFGSTTQHFNATRISNHIFSRNYNYKVQRGHQLNKNDQFNSHQRDLRQKIFVKNRMHSVSSDTRFGNKRNIGNDVDDTAEENEFNDLNTNCDFPEKRSVDTQMHEEPSKMDLIPLRTLAPAFSKCEAWFIVTDFDVLVTEYKFITALTDSDDECHLMVPRRVIAQLKDYVSTSADIQARRILRFLPQQIEIGYAFMGEEPLHNEEDSITEVIIATCVSLAENNYHVILISNDSELLAYQNRIKANIFSVEGIKKLLGKNASHVSTPRKPFVFEKLIKITVPNDTSNISSVSNSVEEVQPNDQNDVISDIEPIIEEIKDEVEEKEVPKRTVDAAIQTDFETVNASMVGDEEKAKNPIPAQDIKKTTDPTLTETNVLKRKIKLNRSVSHQNPVTTADSNVKQFKWRRRRNTTQVNTETAKSHQTTSAVPESIKEIEKNTLGTDLNKQAEKLVNNSPKVAPNRPSDGSIDSKDSSICIEKNKRDNVTIEESSTSDIISNTESNIDSASNYSNTPLVDQQRMVQNDQYYEYPMYEIDSESMEEYLIRKCDEWVSRFIQIMEEVLTQVLQQEPPFSHRAMPPPWTLHEAAQCIAIKFRRVDDIKERANKLSSILFQISDSKGIISLEVKPSEYMQMYSYGVHLIDALSKQIQSCEDLQIAADSLKKLLEDIKNPNMDVTTNDTFNESLTKKSSSETFQHNVSCTDVDCELNERASLSEKDENDLLDGHEEAQTNTPQVNASPVKFIRNIDLKASFFSNLKLQKVDGFMNNSKSQEESRKQISVDPKIKYKGTKNLHSISEPSKNSANINAVENQQKVVRNFTLCAEYEEKFKSKNIPLSLEDHDDELDYEEDYDDGEYLIEEHDDANSNMADMEDVLEKNDCSNPEKPNTVNDDLNEESSKKFKYVTYMLLKEIRISVYQVKVFCNQCYEELQKPDLSMVQKLQKQKQAETAHLQMDRLCKSLQSMVNQEYDEAYETLSKILKQAGVDISHVDENLIFQHRSAISKSLEYAKTFLNAISDIICAFKS